MIFSEVRLKNTLMDNSEDFYGLGYDFTHNVENGFVNLNYQSYIGIINCVINGFRASQASVLSSMGQSSVRFRDTIIYNSTSEGGLGIIIKSPEKFIFVNSILNSSHGISVE